MSLINDIIGGIFGSDDSTTEKNSVSSSTQKGDVNTNSTSNQTQASTSSTGSVTANNQTQKTDSASATRNLSDKEISAADAVLGQLSSNFSPSDLSALATRVKGANDQSSSAVKAVFDRAMGAEGQLNAGSDKIIAGQRAKGEKARDTQFNTVANQGGSAFSTLAQQVFANAENELDVQLSALGAELATKNRQTATAELLAAVDEMQKQSGIISTSEGAIPALKASIDAQNSGSVANLVNALKGAVTNTNASSTVNTTGRSETQQTTNTTQSGTTNTSENKNLDINSGTVTVGKDTIAKDPNLIDLLNAFKN